MTNDPFVGGLMILTMVVALVALMTSKRKNDDNEDGRARKSFMDRHDTSAQSGGRHSRRD